MANEICLPCDVVVQSVQWQSPNHPLRTVLVEQYVIIYVGPSIDIINFDELTLRSSIIITY